MSALMLSLTPTSTRRINTIFAPQRSALVYFMKRRQPINNNAVIGDMFGEDGLHDVYILQDILKYLHA